MSVNLQFNITDAGVKALFTRMSNADFAELNDELGQTLIAELTERFDAALAPDLTPWLPSQRALNEGGTTLTDTRILAASFSYQADADGFLLGTPEVYGAIHHYGGPTGRNYAVDMPERTILGLEDQQQERMDEVYLDWALVA